MQASVRQISTNTKQTPFEWHSSIKKTKTAFKENSHLKKYVKEKGNRNSIQKAHKNDYPISNQKHKLCLNHLALILSIF